MAGKILTYFPLEGQTLQYDDRVHLQVKSRPLSDKYPGYRSYLQSQEIFLTGKSDSILVVGHHSGPQRLAFHLRSRLSAVVQGQMPDPVMAGLAQAMLLGDRSGLEQATREDFRKAGLSHVLAISGLHIGILYLFFNSLFFWLKRVRRGRIIQVLIVLLLLWTFAFLTGNSPSVVRAVTMLSIHDLGRLFSRQASGLSLLSITALLFLVIDPGIINQVGFQLSFVAVAGIMTLSPLLSGALRTRFSKLNRKNADFISVSLGAQMATAPLIIYHFGTFPTYFLLSNLILLPLVSYSVNLGVISLLCSQITGLQTVLFGMLDFSLWLVASLSAWIGNLPGAEIKDLSWKDPGFRAICLIVPVLIIWWYLPRIRNSIAQSSPFFVNFGHGAKQAGRV